MFIPRIHNNSQCKKQSTIKNFCMENNAVVSATPALAVYILCVSILKWYSYKPAITYLALSVMNTMLKVLVINPPLVRVVPFVILSDIFLVLQKITLYIIWINRIGIWRLSQQQLVWVTYVKYECNFRMSVFCEKVFYLLLILFIHIYSYI